MLLKLFLLFILNFILGFFTQYLMYIKAKHAVNYALVFKWYYCYDILKKTSINPLSMLFTGYVVIANGLIFFPLYLISQLYWTIWKSYCYIVDKYYIKCKDVKLKYYILRDKYTYEQEYKNNTYYCISEQVTKDCIIGHRVVADNIMWGSFITFDKKNNIYFNNKKVTKKQLGDKILHYIQIYNSYRPIHNFEELDNI